MRDPLNIAVFPGAGFKTLKALLVQEPQLAGAIIDDFLNRRVVFNKHDTGLTAESFVMGSDVAESMQFLIYRHLPGNVASAVPPVFKKFLEENPDVLDSWGKNAPFLDELLSSCISHHLSARLATTTPGGGTADRPHDAARLNPLKFASLIAGRRSRAAAGVLDNILKTADRGTLVNFSQKHCDLFRRFVSEFLNDPEAFTGDTTKYPTVMAELDKQGPLPDVFVNHFITAALNTPKLPQRMLTFIRKHPDVMQELATTEPELIRQFTEAIKKASPSPSR